jgi:hypothetical protein
MPVCVLYISHNHTIRKTLNILLYSPSPHKTILVLRDHHHPKKESHLSSLISTITVWSYQWLHSNSPLFSFSLLSSSMQLQVIIYILDHAARIYSC